MSTETSLQTRQQIIELKKSGLSLSRIAEKLGLSFSCVRKYFRRFRDLGQRGLERLSHRPGKALPWQTPEKQRQVILRTRRRHPNWGGQFLQAELDRQRFREIPHRRTIERFLHQYPEFTWQTRRRHEPVQDARRATRLHQLWQMDLVKRRLHGAPQKYSFLQIRDMASTKGILKEKLPAGRTEMTTPEVIAACRRAFIRQGFLPEAIRTDHGACFIGPEPGSFPSKFTLWLWGLGVTHELIPPRQPAQNGGIERDQRTFSEHFLEDYQFHSDKDLACDTARFGVFQNKYVPSRSVRCKGRTADETAASLVCQAQRYHPGHEAGQFSVDRIYDRLEPLCWSRQVSGNGYTVVGGHKYYVGWAWKKQPIKVRFDRRSLELVFLTKADDEIKRWPIRGISYEEIVKEPAPSRKAKQAVGKTGRKPTK